MPAGSRLRTVGAVIAAVLVVLVALAPTLLLGESLSAFGLILIGASLLGAGLLVRWGGGTGVRLVGTILALAGGLTLALGIGLTALIFAGWRGY